MTDGKGNNLVPGAVYHIKLNQYGWTIATIDPNGTMDGELIWRAIGDEHWNWFTRDDIAEIGDRILRVGESIETA